MKIAILGAGNMGGALARGLVNFGGIPAGDITVSAVHGYTLERFKGSGFNTTFSNTDAIANADIIVIAVKPYAVGKIIDEIAPVMDCTRQIVLSVAAGVKSEDILGEFSKYGKEPSLMLVIPNTAIEIGQSMTFIAPINATEEQKDAVLQLFKGTGTNMIVAEKQLGAGMALASCGIAYAMRYIRAAAQGGVELGFFPKDATAIVCQTVMGAASKISASGNNPEVEIDKVCTPGGYTIRGLNAMEREGFSASVVAGLRESYR